MTPIMAWEPSHCPHDYTIVWWILFLHIRCKCWCKGKLGMSLPIVEKCHHDLLSLQDVGQTFKLCYIHSIVKSHRGYILVIAPMEYNKTYIFASFLTRCLTIQYYLRSNSQLAKDFNAEDGKVDWSPDNHKIFWQKRGRPTSDLKIQMSEL